MKIIDIEVYIVGFHKTDNNEWETSGAIYGNQIDAKASSTNYKKRHHNS
ncbi:hypothetical protein ACEN3R_04160 [Leuconostoc mesenteroides]